METFQGHSQSIKNVYSFDQFLTCCSILETVQDRGILTHIFLIILESVMMLFAGFSCVVFSLYYIVFQIVISLSLLLSINIGSGHQ